MLNFNGYYTYLCSDLHYPLFLILFGPLCISLLVNVLLEYTRLYKRNDNIDRVEISFFSITPFQIWYICLLISQSSQLFLSNKHKDWDWVVYLHIVTCISAAQYLDWLSTRPGLTCSVRALASRLIGPVNQHSFFVPEEFA